MDTEDADKVRAVLDLLVAENAGNVEKIRGYATDDELLELAKLLRETNAQLWEMRLRFLDAIFERASHPSEGGEEPPV